VISGGIVAVSKRAGRTALVRHAFKGVPDEWEILAVSG
jgi:hypothetical protein